MNPTPLSTSNQRAGLKGVSIPPSSTILPIYDVLVPLGREQMVPGRIRLSRRRGWRKSPDAVVVARPSKWGNPFVVDDEHSRAEAVERFERAITDGDRARLGFSAADVRRELAGRDLACWCPLEDDQGQRVPCHADVLLAIANERRRRRNHATDSAAADDG